MDTHFYLHDTPIVPVDGEITPDPEILYAWRGTSSQFEGWFWLYTISEGQSERDMVEAGYSPTDRFIDLEGEHLRLFLKF